MKTAALVLGITGGLITLMYGLVGFGLGSLADVGQDGSGALVKTLSIGLPVAALVGAGIVKAKSLIDAGLMALTAVAFVLRFGFSFFTLIPVVILGIAALLGVMGDQQPVQGHAES